MIGLDSNVVLRLLADDDVEQGRVVSELFATLRPGREGYLSLIVIVEVVWVMGRVRRLTPRELRELVADLLETEQLVVQEPDLVRRALRLAENGADLADALIAECARAAGCTETVTFDARAARDVGMTLLG